MSAVPALKLTYFDFPGRAEAIRKTLSIANIPFEDTRISQKTFLDQKASFPYGTLPVLDVDGHRFAEMQAILRYTARLGGLYPPPGERVAAALVDEVLDAFEDLFTRVLIPSMMEKDAAKKHEMRLELLDGPLPGTLRTLDNRLAEIATYSFFQKDAANVFVHDVLVWDLVEYVRSGALDHVPAELIDNFKTMIGIHAKVEAFKGANNQTGLMPQASSAALPKRVKLTYFDMPGRAETIRLALHIGGVAFEDERLSYEQYLERKSTLPYGHLPILEVDGVMIAQSTAILRFAGSIAGLYPADGDALMAMRVDEVLSHIGEFFYAMDPWFGEQDPEKRRVLGETLAATTIPGSLASLNKRVAEWKANPVPSFTVGSDEPTIADLMVFVTMQFLQFEFFAEDSNAAGELANAYANLYDVTRAVEKLPRVEDWYASHAEPSA